MVYQNLYKAAGRKAAPVAALYAVFFHNDSQTTIKINFGGNHTQKESN